MLTIFPNYLFIWKKWTFVGLCVAFWSIFARRNSHQITMQITQIILSNIYLILVYATTAANSNESSYACYFDNYRNTYLGDLYSVKWMEDSDQVAFALYIRKQHTIMVWKKVGTPIMASFQRQPGVHNDEYVYYIVNPGRVLPYLGMIGRFGCHESCFWDLQSDCITILCTMTIWLAPLSAKKKSVCLYHISFQRYLDLKLVLFFIKIYYLTVLKHFVSIFSFISIQLTPFFIDLWCCLPLMFTKTYIRLRPFFFCMLNLVTNNWPKYPLFSTECKASTWIRVSNNSWV